MITKIGILTFWDFPEGLAPTTRILAYSKGLVENNIQVEIFSFNRIFKDQLGTIQKSGIVNGASYTYIHFFNTLGKKYKLFRAIDEIILRVKLVYKIFKSNKSSPFSCLYLSFDDLHSFSSYLPLLKFFNFPLAFVADEFPIPIRDFMKDEVPEKMLSKYRYYHSFFSVRILMSYSLEEFYNEKISPKPTFILNTIVDASRFSVEFNNNALTKPHICYMGNLDLRKDNVQNIIEAFSLVEKKYSDFELHLYGTPSEVQFVYLLEVVKKFNLSNNVIFKGKASYHDVPVILKKSIILVNSQPITKRAQGGFPTKLGEYLLSSKPSIFTDSGDISKYIQDGEHAYIVPPENPKAFADKIFFILDNYDQALQVAKNGYNYVMRQFDAKRQTKELINFLESNLN